MHQYPLIMSPARKAAAFALADAGWKQTAIAEVFAVSPDTLSRVMRGAKPVTPSPRYLKTVETSRRRHRIVSWLKEEAGMSYREIGDLVGVSKQRIDQIRRNGRQRAQA